MSKTKERPGLIHDYPMEDVWPDANPDEKSPYSKAGHIFRYSSTVPESGEWVHVETHDFHNQTSYSNNMVAWVVGMARRAVSELRINPAVLPKFNPANKVEVIVRIVPADELSAE